MKKSKSCQCAFCCCLQKNNCICFDKQSSGGKNNEDASLHPFIHDEASISPRKPTTNHNDSHGTRLRSVRTLASARRSPSLAIFSDDEFRLTDAEDEVQLIDSDVYTSSSHSRYGIDFSFQEQHPSPPAEFIIRNSRNRIRNGNPFIRAPRKSASMPSDVFTSKKSKTPPNECVIIANSQWQKEHKEWNEQRGKLLEAQLLRAYAAQSIPDRTFIEKPWNVSSPPHMIKKCFSEEGIKGILKEKMPSKLQKKYFMGFF